MPTVGVHAPVSPDRSPLRVGRLSASCEKSRAGVPSRSSGMIPADASSPGHRDRPTGHLAPDERHRRTDGHWVRSPRALRGQRRQSEPRRGGSPGGSATCPLRRGDRRDPHTARGGQDDDDSRARTGPRLHRAAGDHRHPAGLHGPHLRDQGRRGGRGLQPGCALREPEPAPDGRPSRGHGRQQSPGRHGGQPPLQRERAGPRSARRDVEARARCQRPLTPPHCERTRDEAGRYAAGDRLRHHRSIRGDGRTRARHVAARSASAHGPHRRGLHGGWRARHRRGAQGRRGHDGHHA